MIIFKTFFLRQSRSKILLKIETLKKRKKNLNRENLYFAFVERICKINNGELIQNEG